MFNLGRYTTILGSIAGILATLAVLTLPLMQSCSSSFPDTVNGPMLYHCEQTNLIAYQDGHLELVTFVYLVAMTGLAAAVGVVMWQAKRATFTAPLLTVLLGLILAFGVVIGGFSIGLFWAPALILIELGALVALVAGFVNMVRLKPLRPNS